MTCLRERPAVGSSRAGRVAAEQLLETFALEMDPAEFAAWTSVSNVVLNFDAVITTS